MRFFSCRGQWASVVRRSSLGFVLLLSGLVSSGAFGQVLPPVFDPTGKSGVPSFPEKQQPLRPEPPPEDTLPSSVPKVLPGPQDEQGLPLQVYVKKIQVLGSTVFSESELAQVTMPYEQRVITTEDLEEIRRLLTQLYIDKGYANSGAVIPDQRVQDGIITIRVIEGILTDIVVEGTTWFRPSYIRDRLALSTGPPFNMNPLRDRLQLLLQDSRLERLNAELKPGGRPGEAVLDVKVQEASPLKAWLDFNNFQTPLVGAERGLATIVHQNLTGFGDQASFTYGQSSGVNPIIDASYSLPLNASDTTFSFEYRRNDFVVVESPFNPLDIKSQAEIFSLRLRQPVYRTLTDEVALTIEGERLFNKTTLLGQPFDFVPGTQSGTGTVSALRFAQEWIRRTPERVMAIRSRMSLGIDVLGATINSGPVADGQFFAWLGQANWVERFASIGMELHNRMDMQIANDRLFPLEQMAVGGRYSVRGYRENTLVRDNAFLYSVEARLSVIRSKTGGDILQFCPFIDLGRSWAAKGVTESPETLASVGAGLRLNVFDRGNINVYWGQTLNHVPTPGGNLQDYGVHIQAVFNVF